MKDAVENLLGSTVHHGSLNDRAYLIHLDADDVPAIIPALEDLAAARGYSKILARIPAGLRGRFESAGYAMEAAIADYFRDGQDLYFAARYLDRRRSEELRPVQVEKISTVMERCAPEPAAVDADLLATVTPCRGIDVAEASDVFRQVFDSYPFPIADPDYLAHAMHTHSRYFCVRKRGRIVALAGGEIDAKNRCVEMTDFAVLPSWRGRRLAVRLLARLELEMARAGMRVAFTISRIFSPGMNITFKKRGYAFGGTLTNNTHIAGRIESMWVWYKTLAPESA